MTSATPARRQGSHQKQTASARSRSREFSKPPRVFDKHVADPAHDRDRRKGMCGAADVDTWACPETSMNDIMQRYNIRNAGSEGRSCYNGRTSEAP